MTKASFQKKSTQLGENYSTASARLLRDILFEFVSEAGHVCFRCGKPMTRETFSIEHKDRWLDSDDPVKLFSDLGNIAYSHKSCNYSAARKPPRIYADKKACKAAYHARRIRVYDPGRRHEQYLRTGT